MRSDDTVATPVINSLVRAPTYFGSEVLFGSVRLHRAVVDKPGIEGSVSDVWRRHRLLIGDIQLGTTTRVAGMTVDGI
jgi:hypothetical protein